MALLPLFETFLSPEACFHLNVTERLVCHPVTNLFKGCPKITTSYCSKPKVNNKTLKQSGFPFSNRFLPNCMCFIQHANFSLDNYPSFFCLYNLKVKQYITRLHFRLVYLYIVLSIYILSFIRRRQRSLLKLFYLYCCLKLISSCSMRN